MGLRLWRQRGPVDRRSRDRRVHAGTWHEAAQQFSSRQVTTTMQSMGSAAEERFMMRCLLLAGGGALALLAMNSHAQSSLPSRTPAAQVERVFAGIDPRGPGCNVGVLRDGAWILRDGFGLANLELAVPLDGERG